MDRSCDAEYKVLDRTGLREIGHGKQVSVKTADDLTIRKEVKGVHEDLKLDNYGLSSVKTCIGQSLETQTRLTQRPSYWSLMSSFSGSSTHTTQTEINGVITTKNVLGQAVQDQSTGAVTVRKSVDASSYERKRLVFTDERSFTFQEEQKGRIEKGKMKDMAVVSQLASSVQYKSCCMMDYRTITKKFENGVVTVSDEGLFLKKVTSGKGYVLQSEEEIVLRREESKSLALSSHSCQGIAGALGSGLRHYLREGQVDKELGKAAVKGGAYSWGMSIVTQSIERRHAGGGAAAFAFVQAAQQSLAALRDPTKTNKEKVEDVAISGGKALVVYGALRLASKRMMVSAASWIVPVAEIASEGVRTIVSYYKGEITWARCRSNLTKAVCAAVPAAFGGWGGAAVGAMVGGPLGAAIGAVLGGIAGERVGSFLSSNLHKVAEGADPLFELSATMNFLKGRIVLLGSIVF